MAKKAVETIASLDQKMIDNILNYADEIITLKDFIEAVRKNPGYHIGYIGNKGLLNMFREVFQNSIDEMMKEDSPCDYIYVLYDERSHTFQVADNGRGIPFGHIIRIFSDPNTSSNYQKKAKQFSSGKHGVGSKATNALSSIFVVESYIGILHEARKVEFHDGYPWEEGELEIPNPNDKQGTTVTFKPCYEVMGQITLKCSDVLGLIQNLLPLLKPNAVIDFVGIDVSGNTYKERLINEDGLITDLIKKTTNPLIKPIVLSHITDTMKADIAFTYDSDDSGMEQISSYCNFCPTIAGTHVDGFVDGLTWFFRDYMNRIYLQGNKKITVVNNDIKAGLKAIVSAAHLEPIYASQAKEIVSNDDLKRYIRDLMIEGLKQWVKDNPADLKRLCEYFKEVAKIRANSDDNRIQLSKKYKTSSLTGLPKKFKKSKNYPKGEGLELILIEGDSASGSAEDGRCPLRQCLYPLRGKIPNAFCTKKEDFIQKNEEMNGFFNILGGDGVGKNFKLESVPWEKIIIMTDADPDGADIRTLILRALLVYALPLILDGRVYSAVPPLYGIKIKNGYKYFTTKLDFVRYVQDLFNKNNTIAKANGSILTANECMDILYKNMEYVYDLENISNTYAINPYLLEQCIINKDMDFRSFKSHIEGMYRFAKVERQNGVNLISGLVDSKVQMVVMNEKLLNSCNVLNKYIENSPMSLLFNGEVCSLYHVVKTFIKSMPDNTRYKGIGEMNADQISETALHPDSNRTLIRYTVEDIVREIEAIRHLESDKSVLLKNVKVSKMDIM